MSKTILIVDDSAMIRRIVSQLVQQLGHRAIAAENGQVGVETALATEPDMIIMDIEMPVLDGIAATRQLKADQRTTGIPVIFFTSLGSEENIREAKEAGGNGFLNKPICKEELGLAINKILDPDAASP
ncbi:response regulator [Desulfurivibrio alkaliphilus]|uniref:Response regulator receiver protein n=1 Tax=Desulfurivibrio alkaliphilus (strain DSM 19089 / UNIQEM U267 / AHT2) TaxID=589865 RepID=D6Z0J1_DESAT|nr:response regulator [Desulfurivibrio alkaliphilus]ADH85220.1 response regulator receiver protein [Desulfurivibrio alkaliphilus AHT 2]